MNVCDRSECHRMGDCSFDQGPSAIGTGIAWGVGSGLVVYGAGVGGPWLYGNIAALFEGAAPVVQEAAPIIVPGG